MLIERTLVLVKPDGVKRGLVGNIITRFENAGFKIVAMKMVWIDEKFSKSHYQEHVKKPFYPTLEVLITSGPVVAFVLEGVEAVEVVRKIIGSTEPKKALPGTIRGDFSHHSTAYANEKKKAVSNIIHASATLKEADAETRLWFTEDEIHSYKTAYEEHTF